VPTRSPRPMAGTATTSRARRNSRSARPLVRQLPRSRSARPRIHPSTARR
jgi:hypothetical protein